MFDPSGAVDGAGGAAAPPIVRPRNCGGLASLRERAQLGVVDAMSFRQQGA
jgi:hypothetical protein